jgi:hypothetical protein
MEVARIPSPSGSARHVLAEGVIEQWQLIFIGVGSRVQDNVAASELPAVLV